MRLPDVVAARRNEIDGLGLPPVERELRVTSESAPHQIADEIARISGQYAYLEYALGVATANLVGVKEVLDHEVTMRMATMDGKETIKAKEARIFSEDMGLEKMNLQRIQQATIVEELHGMRNALRAQYDALSRILSAKTLEAEMVRR